MSRSLRHLQIWTDYDTAFLLYCVFVAIYSSVMIYKIAPTRGRDSPVYYISICATVGSVSVMSVKAFGVALKLTFNGNNQFTHPSTYAFMIVVAVSVLTQMNYFNKALNEFTSSMYEPHLEETPKTDLE